MTPSDTGVVEVPDSARGALADLLSVYSARRPGWDGGSLGTGKRGGEVRVLDAEMLVPGRPGIVDVVAASGTARARAVRAADPGRRGPLHPRRRRGGARARSTTTKASPSCSTPRATPMVAAMLLAARVREVVEASLVRQLREDEGSVDPGHGGPHRVHGLQRSRRRARDSGSSSCSRSTRSGFNHLAAPLAVWRRAGRDLGVVQEYLSGASSGCALALTSVRDLYASGGPPEHAGGDFGAEAHRLGTMTARMHLGLDKAFGRRPGDVGRGPRGSRRRCARCRRTCSNGPTSQSCSASCARSRSRAQAIRTHGDFHLGRTCRTEQGWYVVDFATGGLPTSMAGCGDCDRTATGPVLPLPARRRGRHAVVLRARGD